MLVVVLPYILAGKTFYLDPVNGSMSNDGSISSPWTTLEAVLSAELIETQSYSPLPYSSSSVLVPKNQGAPIRSGDTLYLLNGHHGSIFYRGMYNTQTILIANLPGHNPSISDMRISAASNLVIDGLSISPQYAASFFYSQLFHAESHSYHGPSSHIQLRNCTLSGIDNSAGWGLEEWNEVGSCIRVDGENMVVENNICKNIDHGITVTGNDNTVTNNQIINFAGDGMRGLGSYLLFENNMVKNCYDVNENHDDGFQSFTNPENPFVGNILRGNIILNYEDANQPFKGTLQGIGCFDGTYKDWTIENNLVVVNHYHGISMYGAENCRIINNTVIDIDRANSPNGTWIRVTDHKNGTPSEDCTIQNNISFGYSYGDETKFYSNLLISDYHNFVSHTLHDYALVYGSEAIDAGSNPGAPAIDIEGRSRPQNHTVDIGAYEFDNWPECDYENLTLMQDLTMDSDERIKNRLETIGSVQINPSTVQFFRVGNYAELNPGFEISANASFDLIIEPCR